MLLSGATIEIGKGTLDDSSITIGMVTLSSLATTGTGMVTLSFAATIGIGLVTISFTTTIGIGVRISLAKTTGIGART